MSSEDRDKRTASVEEARGLNTAASPPPRDALQNATETQGRDANPFVRAGEAFEELEQGGRVLPRDWSPDDPEVVRAATTLQFVLMMNRAEIVREMSREERWRSLLGWSWRTNDQPEYAAGEPLLSWAFDTPFTLGRDRRIVLRAPVESRLIRVQHKNSGTIQFWLRPSHVGQTRFVLARIASKCGYLSEAKRGYRYHLAKEARRLAEQMSKCVPTSC